MEHLSPDQPEFNPAINIAELTDQSRETGELSSVDELVTEKLNAHGEVDQDGFGREIYALGDQTFSFRSREELPIYPTAEHSSTYVLGSEPKFTKYAASVATGSSLYADRLADYQGNKQRLEAAQSPDKPVHYSVDHSAEGFTQLLQKLQPDNEQFKRTADEVSVGNYSKDALDLIDKIAAVALMDPETGQPRDAVDCNAEAVVALAALGDEAAVGIVESALTALRDTDNRRQELAAPSPAERELVQNSGLMVIHSTRYEPAVNAEGKFATKTLFDATGAHPRASIHASLNHKVEGHMSGSWTDAGFVLVAPLSDMIDANGKPSNLSGVDTWWTRNPGEQLQWQGAVLFAPGGTMNDATGLSRQDHDRVSVKTENFERSDVEELLQLVKKSGRPGRDLITLLNDEHIKGLEAGEEGSLENAVNFIMSDYSKTLLDGESMRQSNPDYAGIAGMKLGSLREAVQRAVIANYLKSIDKEVFVGGMWESSSEAKVKEVASALHISSGSHTGSAEDVAEEVPDPNVSIEYYGAANLLQMDPKARRVLFASGVRPTKRAPIVDQADHQGSEGSFIF